MKILAVDDDEVTRNLLKEILEKEGFEVSLAPSGEEAIKRVKLERFAIVLSDIRMLESDGLSVLREVKKISKETVVILMTGFGSMEGALEAIQNGAFDYISKPFKIQELKSIVRRAAEHYKTLQSSKTPVASPKMKGVEKALLGKSPQIVEVYKFLARAALSESNVLLMGESGVGKELVARAIHENSSRKNKELISIHGSSVSDTDLAFENFKNTTVFIDEVGKLSAQSQSKLFRMIEDADSLQTPLRLITANPTHLTQAVAEGAFREDLFYRLNVIQIEIPPLRERMDDLSELMNHFLAKYAEKNKRTISHVSEEALVLLKNYSWPGNIRELEQAIEHAVAMTRTSVLYPEDFPESIRKPGKLDREIQRDPKSSLEDLEKVHILKVLADVGFNKSKAADVLGIDRATLYRKAQKYGIDLKSKV